MEEMFGNRITGYSTEYYSILFEKQGKKMFDKKYIFLIKKEKAKENLEIKDNLYKRMQNK